MSPDRMFYIQQDCTAFDIETIGSKVLAKRPFMEALYEALQGYDTTKDRVPGQHFIVLPKNVYDLVQSGDGERTSDPNDYIIRKHREGPKMFLKRNKSGPVNYLAVVLYDSKAFLEDPDITEDEAKKFQDSGCTHAIVAVIASSGPKPTVSPFRFVHNLAGGNNEYKPPQVEDEGIDCDYGRHMEACVHWCDWIVDKAKETLEYTNTHTTVAD